MTLRRKKLIPSFCFKLYLSRVYLWRKKSANSQKQRESREATAENQGPYKQQPARRARGKRGAERKVQLPPKVGNDAKS